MIGERVPCDANRFIRPKRTDFRFVHKCAYAYFVKISHFGEQVAGLDKVSLAHGKRIERAIAGSSDSSITDFLFERRDLALRLLDLKAAARSVQMNAARELIFGGGKASDLGLSLGEFQFIGSELISGGSLLRHQALQGVVIALQLVTLRNRFCKVAGRARGFIGSPARICGAKIILRFQKARTRLCEQSGRVLHIQFEKELSLFHLLAFENGDFFDERVELRTHHKRRNRFDFSVAADGGNDVLARGHDRREFCHGLASAQQEEQIRQYGGRKKEEQEPIAESAIHDPRYLRVCKYKP